MSTVAHQIEPRLDHEVDIEGLDEVRALSKRGDTICFRVGEAERLAEATVKLLEDVGDAVGPALGTARAVVTYLEGMWSEIERVIMDVRIHARKVADGNGKTVEATVERIAPEDDPNTTGNSVSGIHSDLNEAIHDVGGRLNACAAIIDAEIRTEDEDEDDDLAVQHVRSIRTLLHRAIDQLNGCETPLARLNRFHIPKRDGEFPTHIIVRGPVTPFHRPLLGAICESAARLGLPNLQTVYEFVETYVAKREQAKGPAGELEQIEGDIDSPVLTSQRSGEARDETADTSTAPATTNGLPSWSDSEWRAFQRAVAVTPCLTQAALREFDLYGDFIHAIHHTLADLTNDQTFDDSVLAEGLGLMSRIAEGRKAKRNGVGESEVSRA